MNTDDDDFDKKIGALFRRKRGRPPMGYSKALDYSNQVDELMGSGMRPTQAVHEVATRNHKHPLHIWACRQLVADTDPREYDPVEASLPDD
jgi:hypothetical protein